MYCVRVGVMVCAMLFIASIRCDGCVDRICDKIPKHYEELGCEEIKDNGACCATRFDCPDFAKYDSSKCHLRNKQYNVSDTLGANDAPNFLAACKCTIVGDQPAAFQCAIVECPEDLGADYCSEDCNPVHDSALCISTYENVTSLCRSKEICDQKEIDSLPECFHDDKMYRLGEKFEPSSHPCYECMCTVDFDNATSVADNANCARIDCGIEIREARHVRGGCTPIYYGRERCCPIDFRCPSNDDHIMDSDLRSADVDPNENACTFGNITLQIDQQLETSEKCMECKCTIPPMITCTQLTDCTEQ